MDRTNLIQSHADFLKMMHYLQGTPESQQHLMVTLDEVQEIIRNQPDMEHIEHVRVGMNANPPGAALFDDQGERMDVVEYPFNFDDLLNRVVIEEEEAVAQSQSPGMG